MQNILFLPPWFKRASRLTLCLLLILSAMLGLLISTASTAAQQSEPEVTKLTIDGTITPVMAMYISRGIDDAVARGDDAILIQMDTPGGLSSAMDDIIADILASPIPVIVWVGPEGARAASAGMYITYAAHVASMAPVTNIGSATPIQLGGEGQEETGETALDRKVVNDAAARARELAELRGRNADWAEEAVRDAVNVGSSDAVELGIIDFIATDPADALAQADGRTVILSTGEGTVNTEDATINTENMSFFERFLQILVDPNIAFVLLSLGTLGVIFELSNPGTLFPGIVGGLMMVTGFFALGVMDANWAGFVLMAFAFALFITEVFVVSGGLLTAGGIVAFLLGGLLLSNTQNPEVLQISRIVIFTVTTLIALFFIFVVGTVMRSHGKKPATGEQSIIGRIGEARTDLDPNGMVFLVGELWKAEVTGVSMMYRGDRVVVREIDGLKLIVAPVTQDDLEAEVKAGRISDPAAIRQHPIQADAN